MSGFVVKLEPGGNLNRIIRNMLERVKRLDGADQVLGFMGILLDDPDEAVSRCNVTAINSFIALDDLRGVLIALNDPYLYDSIQPAVFESNQ